ncbi:MAG: anti-sigma factor [Planctomycetota bacterium]
MSGDVPTQLELAAGVALDEVSCAERESAREISDASFAADVDSFEVTAASLAVAMHEVDAEGADLPVSLNERLTTMGRAWAAGEAADRASTEPIPFPAQPSVSTGRGWVLPLAAALIGLVIGGLVLRPAEPAPLTASALIQSGAIELPWTAGPDPENLGAGVGGVVVWDQQASRGVMVFEGLAPNNPEESVYQLWIFDATRPAGDLPQFGDDLLSQRPIDGGVFSIPAGVDRIEIPIDPKLPVGQAAAFAVTVEPPGGVVVSRRERIPVLALVGS